MKHKLFAVWLAIVFAVICGAAGARAATFTVDSTGDDADANPGDGICSGAGGCTLRAAINEANAFGGADVIAFNIAGAGVHKIAPLSPLPQITDFVTIDGYTQPGATPNTNPTTAGSNAILLIELSGENAGAGADGIRIIIGGSTVRGLVINRFSDDGIAVNDGDGNVIRGNFIGTDATGTIDLGNNGDGFAVDSTIITILSTANTIGGTDPADRNVISGNQQNGINMFFSSLNTVQGNIVGLAADGVTDLGNNEVGVFSNFGSNNTIGGASLAARNVISGNRTFGVLLQSGGGVHVVQGNYIGTDVSGTLDVGNGSDGIGFNVRANDMIGGANPGEGNLISGNDSDGISIGNSNTINVNGNLIGTRADGVTPLGNGVHGIFFLATGATSIIGAAAPNVIAFNGGDGVFDSSGTGNIIRRNSIHSNGGLGIDLGTNGVTPNDAGDADTGPNNLQNFPVILAAANGSTAVLGTLNSTPLTTFTIDIYSSPSADASGHGEGETYLGFTTTTTDAAGDASFSVTVPQNTPVGHFVAATATDPAGNTSEFSAAAQVLAPSAAPVSISGRITTAAGRGIGGATVALTSMSGSAQYARTNSFGYFRFDDAAAGETYLLSVQARRFVFAKPTMLIAATENIADANFEAEP